MSKHWREAQEASREELGVVPWMTISGALILLSGFVALLTLRQARLPQPEKQAAEKKIEPSL